MLNVKLVFKNQIIVLNVMIKKIERIKVIYVNVKLVLSKRSKIRFAKVIKLNFKIFKLIILFKKYLNLFYNYIFFKLK
jgi:hypothetical protein